MTREIANKKAAELLSKMTTEQLIEQWELISKEKMTQYVADTRGWLMKELELRNPEAMDKFYDDFLEDDELRTLFNL